MKHALNTDKCSSILMSCDELHKAIHEMRSEDIIQGWMNIAHQIDELKEKSASSSLLGLLPIISVIISYLSARYSNGLRKYIVYCLSLHK